MLSNYIVRTKELYSFYYRKSEILCRIYRNGRWGKEEAVFRDARENYTVSLDDDGVIYLFCQDAAGDVILCINTDGEFKSQPILKNRSSRIYTLQMNPIITRSGICLVYNLPEEGGNYIALQHSADGRAWSQPLRVDRFTALGDCMFVLQQVFEEHHVLFYQSRDAQVSLGYREITPTRQGQYCVFHSSGYAASDTSFLVTETAIHVVYTVKGLFSSQLIYRKKTGGEFSEPLTLCEAQRLDNILLYCVGGKMYVSFINAEQLFVCASEDGGDSFSRPERYLNKFCLNPVKAVYVSSEPMDEQRFFLRQIYVDRSNPYDVQLIPDLCDEFYPLPTAESSPSPVAQPTAEENELTDLRSQVEMLGARNREQEYQIKYLTELLQRKEK